MMSTPGDQKWACPQLAFRNSANTHPRAPKTGMSPGEAQETSHPVPAAAVGPPPKWTLAAAGGYRSLKPDEAAKEDR
ncbi:hypothetical protein SAMN05660473_03570 [Arthrobacter sp. 49Tsu3.1M3]|nr:hypothetical protein SAMN05660473_03570 [Arthrobacter sp. 49Tsu3.1M3]